MAGYMYYAILICTVTQFLLSESATWTQQAFRFTCHMRTIPSVKFIHRYIKNCETIGNISHLKSIRRPPTGRTEQKVQAIKNTVELPSNFLEGD